MDANENVSIIRLLPAPTPTKRGEEQYKGVPGLCFETVIMILVCASALVCASHLTPPPLTETDGVGATRFTRGSSL